MESYIDILPKEILQNIIDISSPQDILKFCHGSENKNTCYNIKSYILNKYIGKYNFLLDLNFSTLSKLISILYPDQNIINKVYDDINNMMRYINEQLNINISNKNYSGIIKPYRHLIDKNVLIAIIKRMVDLDIPYIPILEILLERIHQTYEYYDEILDYAFTTGKLSYNDNKKFNIRPYNIEQISSALLYNIDPSIIFDYITKNITQSDNVYDDIYNFDNTLYIKCLAESQFPKLFFNKFYKYIIADMSHPVNIGYSESQENINSHVNMILEEINKKIYESYDDDDDDDDDRERRNSIEILTNNLSYIFSGYSVRDNYDKNYFISLLHDAWDSLLILTEYYDDYKIIPYRYIYGLADVDIASSIFSLTDEDAPNISQYATYKLCKVLPFNNIKDDTIKSILVYLGREDIKSLQSLLDKSNL